MKIVVPVKQIPDLVEELEIDASGKSLNAEVLKFKLNEFDEHALEEALLLKDEQQGEVTVLTIDAAEADTVLYTALAKGANKVVKLAGDFTAPISSHVLAKMYAAAAKNLGFDIILTGVQAADDRDGQIGGLMAAYLGVPFVGVVTGVKVEGTHAVVHKEYAGGVMAEFEVTLPAVFGIQAARQAPRYAPVSKVRQAMKTAKVEVMEAGGKPSTNGTVVKRMFKPEAASRAEMLEGTGDQVATKVVDLLRGKGLL